MERRIPKVVGPWLAGTYDKDRVVSRTATDGLSSFLNTDEKVVQFWQRLQAQILDYALESVRETPDTLSDERSTTKEDSEAKYYRVVGASLALVLNLLQKVGVKEGQEQLDQYLGTEAVWALAAAEDSHVRRMVYQLATTCLEHHDDLLKPHLPRLGKAMVSDALKIKQTGSALDYVQVLTTLTTKHKEVWGTKKHPFSRLESFVEKGSQGGSSAFWQELRRLIAVLAPDTISSEVAKGFLKALRAGITSREEPRSNAPYAWACYFETFLLFLDKLTPEKSRLDFIKDTFYPVTEQYLNPAADKTSWTTAAPLSLLPKAWATLASTTSDAVSGEWSRLATELKSRMNNSLPEVSKDFQSSQQSVAGQGDRWFALVGAIDDYIMANHASDRDAKRLRTPFAESSGQVLREAVELLVRRNFKPFGAAAIVESALKQHPVVLQQHGSFLVDTLYLPESDRPDRLKMMLSSSSAPYLLSSLNILGSTQNHSAQYDDIWTELVRILLESKEEESVPARITILISTAKGKTLAQKHEPLQDFLISAALDTARGTGNTWGLLEAALSHEALAEKSVQRLAGGIVEVVGGSAESSSTGAAPAEPADAALRALELLLRHKSALFADDTDLHVQLLSKLLALTEISNETVSARVRILRTLLEKATDGVSSLVRIVQENLDTLGSLRDESSLE
jgi:Trp operon repressor